VAPRANRKVITAKGPLPAVTRHAAKRAGRSVMIERLRRSHLESLSYAAWQERQVSDVALDDFILERNDLSRIAFFYVGALPGPWHASQPVTFPFQLLIVENWACEVWEKALN